MVIFTSSWKMFFPTNRVADGYWPLRAYCMPYISDERCEMILIFSPLISNKGNCCLTRTRKIQLTTHHLMNVQVDLIGVPLAEMPLPTAELSLPGVKTNNSSAITMKETDETDLNHLFIKPFFNVGYMEIHFVWSLRYVMPSIFWPDCKLWRMNISRWPSGIVPLTQTAAAAVVIADKALFCFYA